MSNKLNIYEIIKEYFFSFIENEEFYSRPGKVLSVDLANATAKVQIIDGAEIEDVRLQQVKNTTGLVIVPTVNSSVIVDFTDNTTAHIVMYSEIEQIVFQDGVNKGLVKVTELVGKLNTIESDLNTLKQAFTNWIVAPNDGGLALKTAAATWTAQQIIETEISDLENEKFMH